MKYTIHPYCAAFPDIEGDAFEELKASLKTEGQLESIWTYKGQIIDGKNRERGMQAIGETPTYEEWVPLCEDAENIGEEMRRFVIAKNMARRHLDESQRAMVAAKLATNPHGGDRLGASGKFATCSQQEAAESLNVSKRSVTAAAAVIESGSEELQHAVESGEVSVSDAAAIVDLPKPAQTAAVKAVRKGKAKTVKAAAKPGVKVKKPKEPEAREPGEDPPDPEHDPKHPKDSAGVPIPKNLQKVAATHDLFYSAEKALAIVTGNLKVANRELPQQFKMDERMIDGLHTSMFNMIHRNWFKKLCPKCKGAKCATCGQRGYLVKG